MDTLIYEAWVPGAATVQDVMRLWDCRSCRDSAQWIGRGFRYQISMHALLFWDTAFLMYFVSSWIFLDGSARVQRLGFMGVLYIEEEEHVDRCLFSCAKNKKQNKIETNMNKQVSWLTSVFFNVSPILMMRYDENQKIRW